jgi:chloramphenicol-sensitive protein RarD
MAPQTPQQKVGFLYAMAAYAAWGVFPIYWKFLAHVPVLTIISHRVVWAFVFYLVLLKYKERTSTVSALVDGVKEYWKVLGCAVLIGSNWGIYVWAVNVGHVVETSLGYYISPLINVLLGAFVLGEKLKLRQKLAFVCALIGVLIMTFGTVRGFPWIAMSLAGTFGVYGLLRKTLPLKTLVGSTLETFVMLPIALAILLGASFFIPSTTTAVQSFDLHTWVLLIVGGAVTALPLLWFSEAAKRMPLSMLAFFQYLAPTLQFMCGTILFKEEFTHVHAISFAFIWIGIGIQLVPIKARQRS